MNLEKKMQDMIEEFTRNGLRVSKNIIPKIAVVDIKSAAGRCNKRNLGGLTQKFQIQLSKNLLVYETEEKIINVLAHELIHTIEGAWNHGSTFKYYASKASKLGYKVSVKYMPSETYMEMAIEGAKYAVKCTGCGLVTNRDRLSKVITHPHQYRCSKCGSNLMRIK